MTDQSENTTHPGADAKNATKKCGCDCASMMARFFESHSGDGTSDEKEETKNPDCDCASMMARFSQSHLGGATAEEKGATKGCG